MQTYIMLGRLTSQAKTSPAESMHARDELFHEFEKKGVKVKVYHTMGPFDVVNIVDAPSEDVMMRFLMAVGAQGNLDSVTLRAFTQEEGDRFRTG